MAYLYTRSILVIHRGLNCIAREIVGCITGDEES